MDVKLGEEVGYAIRFENVTNPVRFMLFPSFSFIKPSLTKQYRHLERT